MACFAGYSSALMPDDEIMSIVTLRPPFNERRHEVFRYFTFVNDDRDTVAKCTAYWNRLALFIIVPPVVTPETTGGILVPAVVGE